VTLVFPVSVPVKVNAPENVTLPPIVMFDAPLFTPVPPNVPLNGGAAVASAVSPRFERAAVGLVRSDKLLADNRNKDFKVAPVMAASVPGV